MDVEEPYWRNAANVLAELLKEIPEFDPAKHGAEEVLDLILGFQPPAGSPADHQPDRFLLMGKRQFAGVYETYRKRYPGIGQARDHGQEIRKRRAALNR